MLNNDKVLLLLLDLNTSYIIINIAVTVSVHACGLPSTYDVAYTPMTHE